MIYTPHVLESLDACVRRKDRASYYRRLISLGDRYGELALGVVTQSNPAGVIARSYAFSVADTVCKPMTETTWLDISIELMTSDFAARQSSQSLDGNGLALRWTAIRDYHARAFQNADLPAYAWTAWIPLHLDAIADAPHLWQRMLNENVVVVGVEVTELMLGRLMSREQVDPATRAKLRQQLQTHPPILTHAPADPKVDACMRKLAPYLKPGAAMTDEQYALFYLGTLAESPSTYLEMGAASASGIGNILIPPAY